MKKSLRRRRCLSFDLGSSFLSDWPKESRYLRGRFPHDLLVEQPGFDD